MVKNQEYPDSTKKHLAIVAPLDWGLGHTTRCIPIIRELQHNNFKIVIACNSNQKAVLQAEFPDAVFVFLQGYGLKYGRSRHSTILRLIFQLPKILISIKRENQQFKRILNQFTPNFIISDNRYGVFSSSIRSVFITHQLNILTGAGNIADRIAKIATHRLIKRFDECWVPDFSGSFNLAGSLSHPITLPSFPIRYIGALSRFSSCQDNADIRKSDTGNEINILVILSGPEPQRTILERLIVKQLATLPAKVILVRGVEDDKALPVVGANIELINFADSRKLNQLICDANLVICRSGYTSVMDLVKLGKRSILIPTPGQAEQEYLGRYLGAKKLAVIVKQQDLQSADLQLKDAIISAMALEPLQPACMEEYKRTIRELAASL